MKLEHLLCVHNAQGYLLLSKHCIVCPTAFNWRKVRPMGLLQLCFTSSDLCLDRVQHYSELTHFLATWLPRLVSHRRNKQNITPDDHIFVLTLNDEIAGKEEHWNRSDSFMRGFHHRRKREVVFCWPDRQLIETCQVSLCAFASFICKRTPWFHKQQNPTQQVFTEHKLQGKEKAIGWIYVSTVLQTDSSSLGSKLWPVTPQVTLVLATTAAIGNSLTRNASVLNLGEGKVDTVSVQDLDSLGP